MGPMKDGIKKHPLAQDSPDVIRIKTTSGLPAGQLLAGNLLNVMWGQALHAESLYNYIQD